MKSPKEIPNKVIKALREGGINLLIFRTFRTIREQCYRRFLKDKTVMLFGHPVEGAWNVREIINDIVLSNQYPIELIPDGSVVVDAGANVGVFSIFVAHFRPKAKIYAFEPTPKTFEKLKRNTRHYPNIKVFDYGLGDRNGSSSIIENKGFDVSNYIGEGGTPCELRTLDSRKLEPDFIKIDAEGYEENILKGAGKTIKKYQPIIVMEMGHKMNDWERLPKMVSSISPYDFELRHDADKDMICRPLRKNRK